MATLECPKRLISHVVFDLDGTLINTDGIVFEALKVFLVHYGKEWDAKRAHRIIGKTPLEAASAIVEDYELPCTTNDVISEVTPLLSDRWHNVKALPGAYRLIKHLTAHCVPMALASNSPRSSIEHKISRHNGWKNSFSVIVGVDEVKNGKPSPEIFLEAAKRMSVEPSNCLVIEDSLFLSQEHPLRLALPMSIAFELLSLWEKYGVMAGKGAGMNVIAVPSFPNQGETFGSADEVINSLFDLNPGRWGLPPFLDWIEETLPIEPCFVGGPVIKGFGRGSKLLGIPTANLPLDSFSGSLSGLPSGVYFGWAGLSSRGIYKMVMSIGWNPYFNNTEKTIEPWLLHDFNEDFYGEELHLAIIGYIRPEANFPSLDSLVARIHEDGRIAEKALDLQLYSAYKDNPFLKISM